MTPQQLPMLALVILTHLEDPPWELVYPAQTGAPRFIEQGTQTASPLNEAFIVGAGRALNS